MEPLIQIRNVDKSYGSTRALQGINLEIPAGRIVGLVGPNGAGKTTLLRALTGGINYHGDIRVLDLEPRTQRSQLMAFTGVIHDVAVLPPWMKVRHLLDYMEGVHAKFERRCCEEFLATTAVEQGRKVKQLSKGMKTQLHLAIVMAIETRLLILDEPTHGLDNLFRKRFYTNVLDEYFDGNKSVMISTHQVEEVEHILSDVIFIREGRLLLYTSMDDLRAKFVQVVSPAEKAEEVRRLNPLTEHELFGRKIFLLQDVDRAALEPLGEIQVPSVSDVFVALMGGAA